MNTRRGVEDTRLEAKAKDTKNPKPRPRTAFPRTDTLEAKDRNARGQGQGPRTQAQMLSEKKSSSQTFFRRSPKKKRFPNIFQALHKILTIQKIVLSFFEDLRARGQELDLRGQGQGLQNVFSRTPPLMNTLLVSPWKNFCGRLWSQSFAVVHHQNCYSRRNFLFY